MVSCRGATISVTLFYLHFTLCLTQAVSCPYPLSSITCFLGSFSFAVGVAKHFSAKIERWLSLLSTLPWMYMCCRSFNDRGKSSGLYAVAKLKFLIKNIEVME